MSVLCFWDARFGVGHQDENEETPRRDGSHPRVVFLDPSSNEFWGMQKKSGRRKKTRRRLAYSVKRRISRTLRLRIFCCAEVNSSNLLLILSPAASEMRGLCTRHSMTYQLAERHFAGSSSTVTTGTLSTPALVFIKSTYSATASY